MVPLDRALATSYRLSSNHVFICSGLAAIFSAKFKAISCLISETVTDRAYLLLLTNRNYIESRINPFR